MSPRLNPEDARARAGRTISGGVEPGDFSEALARGLGVIEAFDREHPRMSLAEAARIVGLPRATVRRSLSTLVHLGYMRLEGRSYELTPRVLSLAASYLDAGPNALLQATCERLCAELGEVASVAVLDGGVAVMIARAAPNQLLAAGVGVGHRLPALHTSLGRVLLSALNDDALDAVLAGTEIVAQTCRTTTDKRRIRAAVRRARSAGYAYVDGESTVGFRSVAVPLRRWDGRAIAAMNIGASSNRISADALLRAPLDALRTAAQHLSSQLI